MLALELWWEEGELRFRDPASGQFLLTPEELAADRLTERAARETAEDRAEAAEALADQERGDRMAAEARMAEMEAELRRLRGE